MDLNITVDEASISSITRSGAINIYLIGVDERDLLEQVINKISFDDFFAYKGTTEGLDFLKENYPELFND